MGKAKTRKVLCVETGKIYNSIKDAAIDVGITGSHITKACRGKIEKAAGFSWQYYNKIEGLPGEKWKPAKHLIFKSNIVEDLDGYLVSNKGRIANICGQILNLNIDRNGYACVTLYGNKPYKVHRIVATTFISNDNPLEKSEVNHIDEFDKSNNCVDNLEWISRRDNINYGTKNERTVKTIKRLYGDTFIRNAIEGNKIKVRCITTNEIFDSVIKASEKYSIDKSCISRCCKGKQNYSGKLPDGTKLKWEYYEED